MSLFHFNFFFVLFCLTRWSDSWHWTLRNFLNRWFFWSCNLWLCALQVYERRRDILVTFCHALSWLNTPLCGYFAYLYWRIHCDHKLVADISSHKDQIFLAPNSNRVTNLRKISESLKSKEYSRTIKIICMTHCSCTWSRTMQTSRSFIHSRN